ncbi:MAG: ABC transporter ATP-binding protein [Ruminococcaceae bacterium]|nr:ABC transporter ATP-binding protein [Oscillospiraceae bacterium]
MLFGKHINKYYIKYGPLLLLGILSLVLVDYMQLIVPELYRTVINGINDGYVIQDGVSRAFDIAFLLDEICRPLIFVILCMVFGRFLWRICFFGAGIRIETALRSRMFDRCRELSQNYYQRNKVGNLMSLFTNDLETVQDCFGMGIMMFCDALLLGALAVIKMARMNLLLTFLSMIPMAIMLASGLILGKYMTLRWEKRQEAFSSLSDFSQESFAGISVIKAFVKESKELIAFRWLNRKNEDANIQYTRLSVMMNISVTLLVESVICVILGYGGYLVYGGIFDAGQLVEFIGYFSTIVWPVMAVSQLIEMNSRGKASLNRIGELLDSLPEVIDKEGVTAPESINGAIEFRNLTFRYPDGDYDVLSNASFKINAGENVGIVGRTGAGKTTIADLILRTYNVPDGTVFIDGLDINSIPIKFLRENAAYVPQDNFLFSDTIANNIAFASDCADADKIENAAVLSDIHENISDFPQKYETVLGERGVTVSGGQKQRISIARALMKDAKILILDDSVSAVDVKTEKVILQNLKNTRKGKTTILVAHRITTIEDMDKIIFLDEGRILDVGTHNELYARCNDYRNMVELQRLNDLESKMS